MVTVITCPNVFFFRVATANNGGSTNSGSNISGEQYCSNNSELYCMAGETARVRKTMDRATFGETKSI